LSNQSSQQGFTLVELIAVIVILGILVTVVWARYIDFSQTTMAVACKTNQLSFDAAQTLFYTTHALEGEGFYADKIEDLLPYLNEDTLPVCMGGGTYSMLASGKVICSIARHKR
jgi:prepilin-type N-terminal cleavage/methylation domain-containing protein